MQTIKFLKSYQDNEVGTIKEVSNNEAHFYIDRGLAILFRENTYRTTEFKEAPADKMMKPESKKIRTKKIK